MAPPVLKCYIMKYIISTVFSLCLLFILLLTSVEAVCYWTPNYFRQEYDKYQVLNQVNGQMTMDSVMEVTDEMMAYLRGTRPDLVVETVIDGKPAEFFNAREKAHMADVRRLFLAAFSLRTAAACIALAALALLAVLRYRCRLAALARAYLFSCACIALLSLILALMAAADFTKYFTIFHEIFFDNDLWLLDARTDNLINLLPEGFFIDTALRILLYFLGSVLSLAAVSILYLKGAFSKFNVRAK